MELGTVFRADAKAEGMTAVIGGWECRDGCPPGAARWFRVHLTRATAPWAFARGEPFRTVASLELFASLVSLMVFGPDLSSDGRATMAMTGLTDNAGNQFALAKLMSSKFPLVVILTELAAQLRARRLELILDWIPRGQNEAADALTNDRLEAFDRTREVQVSVADLPFIVLPAMLQVADHLYASVRARRAAGNTGQARVEPPG